MQNEHARYWERQAQTARNRAATAEREAETHEAAGRVAWAASLRRVAVRERTHACVASTYASGWRLVGEGRAA